LTECCLENDSKFEAPEVSYAEAVADAGDGIVCSRVRPHYPTSKVAVAPTRLGIKMAYKIA